MPRPTPPSMSLALTFLRVGHGWTRKDLAEALGIPQREVSRYETGRTALSRERLEAMTATLGFGPRAIDLALDLIRKLRKEPAVE